MKNSLADTAQKKNGQVLVKQALPNPDSLRSYKSIAAQELGDIFYSEIVVPDSAYYWYNNALEWNYRNARSPRILFILAELSRTNPEKKYPPPEEYYTRLEHDFPESVYAEEGRRLLQSSTSTSKADTAALSYALSEKQLDAKEYSNAIGTLRSIIRSFPSSPMAAKSAFAIGWILENRLDQPDSAWAQYKRVAKNYNGTAFAAAASRRFVEEQKADTVKKDTSKVKMSLPGPAIPDSLRQKTAGLKQDTVRQEPGQPEKDLEQSRRKKAVVKPKYID